MIYIKLIFMSVLSDAAMISQPASPLRQEQASDQRPHLSHLLYKNSFIRKLDQTVSILHDIHHLTGQKPTAKDDPRTGLRLFSGLYKCLPDIVFLSF